MVDGAIVVRERTVLPEKRQAHVTFLYGTSHQSICIDEMIRALEALKAKGAPGSVRFYPGDAYSIYAEWEVRAAPPVEGETNG